MNIKMVEIAAKTPTRVIICTRVAERSGLFGEIVFVIKASLSQSGKPEYMWFEKVC